VLQLPVRDTRGVQKAATRRARDIARQKDIRLAAAGPGDPADRPFGRR
jgi:membrane protein